MRERVRVWRVRGRAFVVLAALLPIAMVGCRGCEGEGPRPGEPAPPASPAPQAPPPSATAGPWQRAARGDALALGRLAELHGAAELWAVASQPSERAVAALAALVRSPDAERVLGEMAESAQRSTTGREAILGAILQVAARPPRQGEPLDPPSLGRCIAALDVLSRDRAVERRSRALAVSALRAFARAGYVGSGTVTRELDPRP
jgi:hypothetical protein